MLTDDERVVSHEIKIYIEIDVLEQQGRPAAATAALA